MTDQTGAPAGEIAAPADNSELSIEDARKLIFAEDTPEIPGEGAENATPEPESSKEDGAPEKDPAEDAPETDPEADQPEPIEPPRSWTKAEKERFQSLPRETQEYLHTREQERERDFRRSQNEIAEERKAAKAEREAAEQARKQYETAKLDSVAALEREQQRDFPDIRTMDDVRNLQRNDPFRFQEWQIHQMSLSAAVAEKQQIEGKQAQEKQSKRNAYEVEQNKLLVELVPEMADPKKANELRGRAIEMLTNDLGLKDDLLSRWMKDDTGHEILSNASIQKLIADGLKLRDIQNAPKAIAAKPLPPVQRPGARQAPGSSDAANLQALEERLTRTGSIKDAEALLNAQLAAQRRRAS
jgi:hypothetical protein